MVTTSTSSKVNKLRMLASSKKAGPATRRHQITSQERRGLACKDLAVGKGMGICQGAASVAPAPEHQCFRADPRTRLISFLQGWSSHFHSVYKDQYEAFPWRCRVMYFPGDAKVPCSCSCWAQHTYIGSSECGFTRSTHLWEHLCPADQDCAVGSWLWSQRYRTAQAQPQQQLGWY